MTAAKLVFVDREDRFDYWVKLTRIHLALVARTLYKTLRFTLIGSWMIVVGAALIAPADATFTVLEVRVAVEVACLLGLFVSLLWAADVGWRWYREDRAELREEYTSR